jgi:hypothetical protein
MINAPGRLLTLLWIFLEEAPFDKIKYIELAFPKYFLQ